MGIPLFPVSIIKGFTNNILFKAYFFAKYLLNVHFARASVILESNRESINVYYRCYYTSIMGQFNS